MAHTLAKPLPDAALCELLLSHNPGCAWLLKSDGTFAGIYGDATRIFGRGDGDGEWALLNFTDLFVPPARASWTARLERVFAGETVCAAGRFATGSDTFSITMFPVQPSRGGTVLAGGMAHHLPVGNMVLRALETRETDSARLSRLLHDHVGQYLSAAGMQLDLLRMDLAERALEVPQRLDEIQGMLETTMGLVRDVHRELNPVAAERIGLPAALDRLAERLSASFKGNLRLFVDATEQPSPKIAVALYRIAQEAAESAARRKGCSDIEILLKSLRSGPALEIRDNGLGCNMADSPFHDRGLELLVMQHLADEAGIELQFDSAPASGTVVRAICRSAEKLDAGGRRDESA